MRLYKSCTETGTIPSIEGKMDIDPNERDNYSCRGLRVLAFIKEPEMERPMPAGLMEFTGGDTIYARDYNGTPCEE